jgi:malate dehydrogenase (oxaloacetate-decarboxylating)
LTAFYTPGVALVSKEIIENPERVRELTSAAGAVAVVSDGSAVLGLGNVGPRAALPVMEGKAMLFRELGGVNAWPIVLATQDPEEVVQAVRAIAPGFGGINLEDIAAPACFEIERRLQEELDIPVVHDDQHATAIVVLAGLYNALKVVGKDLAQCKVVVNGAGAAGSGIARLLHAAGVGELLVVDSKGILSTNRTDLSSEKLALAQISSTQQMGDLQDASSDADVLIGVSVAGAFNEQIIRVMNSEPIIFALANPEPEILPEDAKKAGATVVATGRSDFPNQINNVLVFPGLFRGLMAARKKNITVDDKLRVAQALAGIIDEPAANNIVPDVFDKRVASCVAQAIIGGTI